MSLGKWILLGFLLLPLVEVSIFIAVATKIGFLAALGLCMATSLIGFAVLGKAGRGRVANFRVAVADGKVSGAEVSAAGFLTVLAGILLVLPGFLTDALGFLLLVPPLQRWAGAAFGRAIGERVRKARGDGVVDLEADEWRRVDDRKLKRD